MTNNHTEERVRAWWYDMLEETVFIEPNALPCTEFTIGFEQHDEPLSIPLLKNFERDFKGFEVSEVWYSELLCCLVISVQCPKTPLILEEDE